MPTVRRDIHNVVIPVDLANAEDLSTAVEEVQGFVKNRIPVRFGLVPTVGSPESRAQAKIAWHIYDTYGLGAFMKYLQNVGECRKTQLIEMSSC